MAHWLLVISDLRSAWRDQNGSLCDRPRLCPQRRVANVGSCELTCRATQLLYLLPQRTIGIFIEWGAAGRKLAQGMILGTHQRGTVAKCSAKAFAVELTVIE